MATPGELIETTANALDRSVGTVRVVDRVLSEAGLRTKSGRGTSAAKATARDAASLMIAMAGNPVLNHSAARSAETVRTLGTLRAFGAVGKRSLWKQVGLSELAALPVRHTALDFLSTLLDAVSSGRFEEAIPETKKRSKSEIGADDTVSIWDFTVHFSHRVDLQFDYRLELEDERKVSDIFWAMDQQESELKPPSTGLKVGATVTFKFFREVGALLAKSESAK